METRTAISPIASDDELTQLLGACDLLFSDLGSRGGLQFYGSKRSGALVGAVGLEAFGEVGLLRSLAVHPSCRGGGLGRALVQFVEAEAVRARVRSLYLLTTTAGAFFARLGFHHTDRDGAPPPIRTTSQFSGLCPTSAHLMVKRLKAPAPREVLGS